MVCILICSQFYPIVSLFKKLLRCVATFILMTSLFKFDRCHSLFLAVFFIYPVVIACRQEAVDVMEGLSDAQAAKIAKHLKLDGPSFEAVRTPSPIK